MSCCCNKVLHLCRVRICGADFIQTGITADVTGEFTLVLDFLGVEVRIRATITSTNEIKFPSTGLNENFTYTGYILNPSGEQIEFSVGEDDTVYNCISFQTGLSYDITEEGSN